jgi:hypothetical protein
MRAPVLHFDSAPPLTATIRRPVHRAAVRESPSEFGPRWAQPSHMERARARGMAYGAGHPGCEA